MSSITLRAHFNGSEVVLDEPFSFKPDAKLLVTVLTEIDDAERDEWLRFSASGLNYAYGDDEPEYTLADLKEINPNCERR